MMAFFCRCRDVTSSDVLMDYLLEDRREVVDDSVLEVWRQSLPDRCWINGHSASHSPATVRSSWSASLVSLVGTLGRFAASVVEALGMHKAIASRYPTRTWPGPWGEALREIRGKWRP